MQPQSLARSTRGTSIVEYLIVIGAVGICALAGFRAMGTRIRAMAEAQAGCVSNLVASGACIPGRSAETADGEAPASLGANGESAASAKRLMRSVPRGSLPSTFVGGLFSVGHLGGAMTTRPAHFATVPGSGALASTGTAGVPADTGLTDTCFPLPPAGGSASVTLELGDKRVAAEVSVSSISQNSTGGDMVTVSVQLSAAEFIGLEAELGRMGFTWEPASGGSVTVSYTVPVTSGSACVPDLLDPGSWPVGTAVLVEANVEGSMSTSISYSGVQLGGSTSRSEGVAVALVRVDEDTTAVMVGTASSLSQAVWVGVGIGPVAVGLKGSDEEKHSEFLYVEMDDDGTTRVGNLTIDSYSGTLSAYLSLEGGKFAAEISVTLSESGVEVQRTTWIDGQPSTETFTIRNGDVVSETRAVDGVDQTVTVRMPVSGYQIRAAFELFDPASAACIDGEGDYYFSYTATPSDAAVINDWVRQRREQGRYDACNIGGSYMGEGANGEEPAFMFGFWVAYCNGPDTWVPTVLVNYADDTGQSPPGQLVVYDHAGQRVHCS